MLHRRSVVKEMIEILYRRRSVVKEMIEILYRRRGEKSTHKKRTGIPHAVVQEPVLAV